MSDDLILLVSYVAKNLSLHKVCLTIPHGMNRDEWSENWKYYREPQIAKMYKESFPLYIKNHIHAIVAVEEIFATCMAIEEKKENIDEESRTNR